MANVDVLGCTAAIVSAFQTGADIVQSIRARRSKKWRLKEKDLEQAVELKILHKSLVNGADQCQAASTERCQRYGEQFATGDTIAIAELKDVMITLQTEVISALQIGRAVENATLDLLALQEAVITNKANTFRAFQDLCQRIMTAAPQPQADDDIVHSPTYTTRLGSRNSLAARSDGSRGSLEAQCMAGLTLPQAVSMPAPGIPERSPARISSRLQSPDTTPKRSLTRSLKTRSSAWFPQIMRPDNPCVKDEDQAAKEGQQHPVVHHTNRANRVSLHDSAVGSSIADSGHKPSASITSTSFHLDDDERRTSCATADSFEQPEDFYKDHCPTSPPTSPPSKRNPDLTHIARTPQWTGSSTFPTMPSPSPTQWESPDDFLRDERAQRTVMIESEPVYRRQSDSGAMSPRSPTGYPLQNIHPAFRNPYTDDAPAALVPESDVVWAPLSRPAKINNYHNFCRGAWQARSRLEEGLSISLLPNQKGQIVPHWKCKQCAFQSEALDSSNILPDNIALVSNGVRYRWAFLAKSHVHADTAQVKPENYSFGCTLCAAQGSETAVYVGLESLMAHIVAKHKTSMLTPEVLEKTRCSVGGATGDEEDWDINLPQSHQRKLSGRVGDFVVSAVTGFR